MDLQQVPSVLSLRAQPGLGSPTGKATWRGYLEGLQLNFEDRVGISLGDEGVGVTKGQSPTEASR